MDRHNAVEYLSYRESLLAVPAVENLANSDQHFNWPLQSKPRIKCKYSVLYFHLFRSFEWSGPINVGGLFLTFALEELSLVLFQYYHFCPFFVILIAVFQPIGGINPLSSFPQVSDAKLKIKIIIRKCHKNSSLFDIVYFRKLINVLISIFLKRSSHSRCNNNSD
jgi:hypothetical protein